MMLKFIEDWEILWNGDGDSDCDVIFEYEFFFWFIIVVFWVWDKRRLNYLYKGKFFKDKCKLREKRWSIGVVNL